MSRILLSLSLPLVTAAQLPPPISVVPPAPHAATPSPAQRTLVTWRPEAQCEGGPLAIDQFRRPAAVLAWGTTASIKPIDFRFTLTAEGRTVNIQRDGGDYVPFTDDLAPALAASQFTPGVRRACRLRYVPEQTSLARAARADLITYWLDPISGPLPREAQDVIHDANTCFVGPNPQPLLRAFPDFTKVRATPGVRDWSLIGYDIDAAGRPIAVRHVQGTGNAALDASSIGAVRASRFTGGPRTGCLYSYWRKAGTLAAPPIPTDASLTPVDASCPAGRTWITSPVLRFPEPYRRRGIEGWAVLAYDVAPWGEIGNIRVLAAQPSADFGTQAIQLMRAAKLAPSREGAVGCVDRVRFVMGAADGTHDDDRAPPPPF